MAEENQNPAPTETPPTASPSILGATTPPDGKPPAEGEPAKPQGEAPAGEKPAEAPKPGEAPKEGEKPKEAAPLDFEKLALPEGVTLEGEALNKFKEFATSKGLSQEEAQNLVTLHADTVKAVGEAAQRANTEAWNALNEKWQNEVKADKEVGGDNLARVTATVAKALEQYGAPGIKEALDLTGAGNNPAILKTFFKMSQALTEGQQTSQGRPPGVVPKSAAHTLYPDLP